MSLSQLSKEEIQEMSLIEVAYELLAEKKQAIAFQQLMDELAQTLGLSEGKIQERIAQFYTDLNIDGRFLCLGENQWGLRIWYPVDQVTEEIVNPVKAKKKKKAKKVVEKLDDFDDIEELEVEEFDDLEDFAEDDDDLLDDEDDDDDDLIEDDLAEPAEDALDEDLIDEDLDADDDLDDDEFEMDEEEQDLDDAEEEFDDDSAADKD